jgi:hypothetical protein
MATRNPTAGTPQPSATTASRFIGEIVVTRPEDERLALWPEASQRDPVRYEQANGEPLFLVIAPHASDAELARASARFGLPFKGLREFRDAAFAI